MVVTCGDLPILYILSNLLLFIFTLQICLLPVCLSGNEMHNHIARDDDRTGHRMLKDTQTIGSAYDRYLQSGVTLHLLMS